MTVKKHTPSGAQRSTSARTTNRPARPKNAAAPDKKDSAKSKAEGSKKQGANRVKPGGVLAVTKDDGEAFKRAAVDYAKTAYAAALAHFEANEGDPFALSRLAVVYEKANLGDAHMVVTLPGRMRDSRTSDEDVRGWVKSAELLARTLEHPDCGDSFKQVFGLIFTEHMLADSGISWTTPEVMRVMLPLVMLEAEGTSHVCEATHTLDILMSLSCELVPDEVDREVRASLGMQ